MGRQITAKELATQYDWEGEKIIELFIDTLRESNYHKEIKLLQSLKKENNSIIQNLDQQEKYILSIRERLEKRNLRTSQSLEYERAKFIGMLEIAKILEIDVSTYSWIYNI